VPTQQLQDATTGLEVASAQLEVARFNQAHAVIRAPFAGRVLKRLAEPDELVAPGTPVVALASSESGWVVRVGLVDRDLLAIAQGDPAQVRIEAGGVTLPAHVSELASAASAPAGTFEVELTLDGPLPRLAAGLVATVEITPQRRAALWGVPVESLVDGHGLQASVFVVDGQRVRKVPVEVAYLAEAQALVRRGLQDVPLVVSTGTGWLTEGAAVEVAP
jgi:RND family efflux transporter MFP subunit